MTISASLAAALGPRPPKTRPEGIATYKPAAPGQLDGKNFTAWISSQVSAGRTVLGLAEGAYHVLPGFDQAHVFLENLESVTIWMDSVNLTMTAVGVTAFEFYRCSNITTYGPTVWWDTPGFSQATITNVKSTGDKDYDIQFHLDDGYDPSFLVNTTTGQMDGEYTDPKTGRLEAGPGWSFIRGPVTTVQGLENTYSVALQDSYFQPLEGYKLLARGDFIFCNKITESNNTIISDFTLLNCAGFGFFSGSNRKTTFNSFSLKPAPFPPPNGTELPVRSSSADGIHSGGDYIEPTFDSCLFSALDDDCMAVHGSLFQTSGAGSTPNSFLAPNGLASPGDVLHFYANSTFALLGTATVVSANTSSSPLSVTVDHLPASVAEQIRSARWSNQNRVGSGFRITNTLTTGNRGRGAIIKASNGLIAGNRFEGVSYAALSLGPEFSGWAEADYVHNISVVDNTLADCNYLSKAGAAFMLHGDGGGGERGNSNISIEGLVVQGTSASNVYLGASEGVRLGGLRLERVFQAEYQLWEEWPGAVVTLENVGIGSVKGRRCIEGEIGREGVEMVRFVGSVDGVEEDFVKSC
ncbi:hypothetical protein G7Y79_00005g016800 [Physcia stellaris]|nr:hypothetical protein G7Y79_00005g016800 [Physcia stellaris]